MVALSRGRPRIEGLSNQDPFSNDETPAPLAKDEEHAALDQEPIDEERNPSGKGLARDMGPFPSMSPW